MRACTSFRCHEGLRVLMHSSSPFSSFLCQAVKRALVGYLRGGVDTSTVVAALSAWQSTVQPQSAGDGDGDGAGAAATRNVHSDSDEVAPGTPHSSRSSSSDVDEQPNSGMCTESEEKKQNGAGDVPIDMEI